MGTRIQFLPDRLRLLDKDRNVLFLFILFLILLLGLFIIQTEYHEEAHLEIDKLYGLLIFVKENL